MSTLQRVERAHASRASSVASTERRPCPEQCALCRVQAGAWLPRRRRHERNRHLLPVARAGGGADAANPGECPHARTLLGMPRRAACFARDSHPHVPRYHPRPARCSTTGGPSSLARPARRNCHTVVLGCHLTRPPPLVTQAPCMSACPCRTCSLAAPARAARPATRCWGGRRPGPGW